MRNNQEQQDAGGKYAIMKSCVVIGCVLAAGLALPACQTPQSRQAELTRICSDPYNRQSGSFYYGECQSVFPPTTAQRQQDYFAGSPTGD